MSTRILPEFDYYNPGSIHEAIALAEKYGDKAKFIAGGTDLLIEMKQSRINLKKVIDIREITDLQGITMNEGGLKIGAVSLLSEVASHPVIVEKYSALSDATSIMGPVQIRNIATIGGNLCNGSPGADSATPLLALNAEVGIATNTGMKVVPIAEFHTGPGKTILSNQDILIYIQIPEIDENSGSGFIKVSRTQSDLAQLNSAVFLSMEKDICEEIRIALGVLAPTPVRATKAEEALKGISFISEDIDKALGLISEEETHKGICFPIECIDNAMGLIDEDINPRTSFRSTCEYREKAAPVITKRALLKAYERIRNKDEINV